MLKRSWGNVVTLSCIIIAAVVEATQQALSRAPNVTPYLPDFAISPKWNYVPLLLLMIAGVAWLMSRVATRKEQSQQGPAQGQAGTAKNPPQFKNVDEFYQTYSSRMLTETEAFVRKESDQYEAGTNRERFLVRVTAMFATVLIFEKVWLTIFGSQLKALQQLNIGMRTYDEMREYYNEAAKLYPDFYKTTTFEMWLGFLKSWLLVREPDSSHLEITIRGQDFLRYLVECRYDPALRLG
jgi:hypothetical protein